MGKESPISLLAVEGNSASTAARGFGSTLAGAAAASKRRVVVPLSFNGRLAILDAATGQLEGSVETGVAPFAAVIRADGRVAWVSNWGGRIPKQGERSAPLGSSRDRAVVDARGIAASGTVQRVDLEERRVTHSIETGLHPTALAWDQSRGFLYVANSNADSLTVIDTTSNRVAVTTPLDFFTTPAFGIAPTALVLSPDGGRLWVACGGINAVAQFRTNPLRLEGLIPTAYYPHDVAISPEGEHLLIGTFFGVGEGSVEKPNERHQFAARSTAHVISVPHQDQLAAYTQAVAENTRLVLKGETVRAAGRTDRPSPVPRVAGDPSTIQHVVYVIKENQTYDAMFGAVKAGNGDPTLAVYGHAWMTQANTVSYLLWPGWTGRGYPFSGIDPLTFSENRISVGSPRGPRLVHESGCYHDSDPIRSHMAKHQPRRGRGSGRDH